MRTLSFLIGIWAVFCINSWAKNPPIFRAEFFNTSQIVKLIPLTEEEKEGLYWVDNRYVPRIKQVKKRLVALYVQLRILTASGKLKLEEFEAVRERILALERVFWDWLWTYYQTYRKVLREDHRKLFDEMVYKQLKMFGDPDEILQKLRSYIEEKRDMQREEVEEEGVENEGVEE